MIHPDCETIKNYIVEKEYPHEISLDLDGFQIKIKTNSAILKNELQNYFKDFLAPAVDKPILIRAMQADIPDLPWEFTIRHPDPGKSKIKEEYMDLNGCRVVRKTTTGLVLAFGRDFNLAYGPCEENPNQVINFINNRVIESLLNRDMLLGHAAGVKYKKKGLAIAGFSGMGKSTLALHLMSLGTTFISNDRLLLEKRSTNQIMYGVPKMPRINPGTALNNNDLASVIPDADRKKFSKLPQNELWDLEHKYDVFIEKCFGPDKFELSSSYSGLVLLNWRHCAGKMKMEKIDINNRKDLLPAFMKDPGLFFLPEKTRNPDLSRESYINALKNRPIFEISGGIDFDAAARECLAFLKE